MKELATLIKVVFPVTTKEYQDKLHVTHVPNEREDEYYRFISLLKVLLPQYTVISLAEWECK